MHLNLIFLRFRKKRPLFLGPYDGHLTHSYDCNNKLQTVFNYRVKAIAQLLFYIY